MSTYGALCIALTRLAAAAAQAGESACTTWPRASVERLLAAGADVSARTQSGVTPLRYAAFTRDPWFAMRLVQARR